MRKYVTSSCLGLILLTGLAVFWPGLHGGFIFDDHPNLVLDPDWKVVDGTWREWLRALRSGISSSAGRPLAMLSFAANHYFSGLDPWPMKLTGLLWHIGNAMLVWLLARRLLALAMSGDIGGDRQNPKPPGIAWVPLLLALAWMLHPLQVSSALYVVQRMEVAAATGILLSLLAYLRARQNLIEGKRAWPWLTAAGLAVGFGLCFKETALLAPGFALLVEACLLSFAGPNGSRSRPLMLAWSLAVTAALAVYLLYILPSSLTPWAYNFRDFTLGQRLLTQMPVLAMYIGQVFWPLPEQMLFYYDQFPISNGLLAPPTTLFSGLGLLALLLAGAAAWRRWPLTALGIGWFFMGHALTSNVIPLELAFEHRNYLALFGLLLALVQPLAWLGRRMDRPVKMLATALPVLLVACMCLIHAHTWGDPMRLALALAARNPESERAGYALGGQFYTRSESNPESPAWSLARSEYEHAANLPGSTALPDHALLIMEARAGHPSPPERWESLRRKLSGGRRAAPPEVQSLYGLVDCRIRSGCDLDDQQLLDTLVAALEHNPGSATLHTIYSNFAFNVMHDHGLAIRMSREALRLNPRDTVNRVNLARFLLASNLRDSSMEQEARALMEHITGDNADGRWDQDLQELQALAGSPRRRPAPPDN